MNKENEMRFVDSSNEDQNYSPVPSSSPSDGKLGGVRMVRIRLDRKCAPSECRTDKPYFQINSISAIDDNNPQNENEVRLFDAELAIPRCCPQPPQFNFFDTQSRQPYSLCRFDGFPINHYGSNLGLRTKETMKDDKIWRRANRFNGFTMFIASIIIILLGFDFIIKGFKLVLFISTLLISLILIFIFPRIYLSIKKSREETIE